MTTIRTRLQPLVSREVLAGLLTVTLVVVGVAVFYQPSSPEAPSFYAVDTDAADYAPLTVGAAAPDFTVATTSGEPFDLAAYAGRPVWINVWASWCPPCRAEMPDIEAARQLGADELVFIAMNFQEDEAAVAQYLQNIGYDFTVGLDPEGQFASRYGVLGLPTHIFIDADGKVDAFRVGGMTRAEMDEKVNELTSEARSARR